MCRLSLLEPLLLVRITTKYFTNSFDNIFNRKVWGRCNGCPGWNGCCWRAPDILCEAFNLGCKGLRAIAYAALEFVKRVVDSSRWTLDFARAVLRSAEFVVDSSRFTLDVAKGVLEGVKFAANAGLQAAKAIVNFGLGGVFSIRKIEFDIKIGLVQSGHFNGNVELTILNKFHRFAFELRLQSVKDMVLDLADRVFPGISGRSKRAVEDRMKRAFPDFSEKHHFPRIYRPGSYANTEATAQFTAQKTPSLDLVNIREARNTNENDTDYYTPYESTTTDDMEQEALAGYTELMEARQKENYTGIESDYVMDEARHFVENQTRYTGYNVGLASEDDDSSDENVEYDASPDLPPLQSCSEMMAGKPIIFTRYLTHAHRLHTHASLIYIYIYIYMAIYIYIYGIH